MEEEREELWPVEYNDKLWYEKDCGEIFKSFYHTRFALRVDGAVYGFNGGWIFPDDTIEYED